MTALYSIGTHCYIRGRAARGRPRLTFDRVVPGFLVQTGDRTGTGGGGESFYGGMYSLYRYLQLGL